MLQAIRSKATSFVVKILFGVLIITFGLWGIGDIFRGRGTDTTVATVGDRTITVEQLQSTVQAQMQRLQNMFGGKLDAAQAKQLGVVDSSLQQLVSTDLVDNEIDRLHLKIGDATVSQAIISNPAFHNQSGVFDRDVLASVLSANQLSEPEFEVLYRSDLLRDQFTSALIAGWTPPKELVDTLYRAEFERRIAASVTLPPDSVPAIPAPTDAQLADYYKAHQNRFQAPELRSFKVAMLTVDDVAPTITVPPDKLKQEYQARADEFNVPEQRQLQQMLLPDEAKAKEAEAQLTSGKDFAAVGKAVANEGADALDLGWVKRTDIPDALAGAAFALKVGEVSPPIQSSFGWHILRLVAVKPPALQTLDQVKDKLTKEVQRDMAGDQIAKMANQIDDALAGGASLGEVAQKFALKTTDASDVTASGQTADHKDVDLPKPKADILKLAFATNSGQTSELTQIGEDGYCIVQVDKVTPAAERPLADVHDEAAKLWQTDQRNLALAKEAEAIAGEVNAGKSLKDVAAAHKLTIATSEPLLRSAKDKNVPPTLVAKLFQAKPGQAVAGQAGDAATVAQLVSIVAADPSKDAAAVDKSSKQLGSQMQNDLMGDLDQALRRKYPVEINQANLANVL